MLHKNTLVDILFVDELDNMRLGNNLKKIRDQKQQSQIFCKYDKISSHTSRCRQTKKKSQIIKITQFNSSVVLGEEFATKPITNSPNNNLKKFNIKKINDIKTKIIQQSQKYAQKQLRKNDKFIKIGLDTKFSNSKKHNISIQKILISTKCKVKIERPDIEALTSHIIFGDQNSESYNINFNESYFSRENGYQQFQSNGMQQQDAKGQYFSTRGSPDTNKRVKCDQQEDNKAYYDYDKRYIYDSRKQSTRSPKKHYTKHIDQQKRYQQNIQKQKRQFLELKKELNKNYAKPFMPPQNLTAFSYIIYEADAKKSRFARKISLIHDNSQNSQVKKHLINSHKIIVSANNRVPVQIASLTKIMTCILILDLSKKFQIDITKQMVTIGFYEQNIGGTSARIQKGEIYSIEQLLYGLMLPSGNDASLALAVWGGRILLQRQQQKLQLSLATNSTSNGSNSSNFKKKQCCERFILQMNSKAMQLNMQKTKYANTHGLSNSENKSCPYDLAILCQYAISNPKFRQIVSCKSYQTSISFQQPLSPSTLKHQPSISQKLIQLPQINKDQNVVLLQEKYKQSTTDESLNSHVKNSQNSFEDQVQQDNTEKIQEQAFKKQIRWQNSHQLLQEKCSIYKGIKTGVTDTAGPCLSSCIQVKGRRFIIIVLNCKNMKYRFKDTQVLRKWLFNKQQIKLSQVISYQQQKQLQRQ